MDLSHVLSLFVNDNQFVGVVALIILDLILGVAAAVYTKTFALSFVSNFARNDLLGKVFPWFLLYYADKASGNATLMLGVDLSTLATGVFVTVVAALVGSLVTSLGDFGVTLPQPLQRKSA